MRTGGRAFPAALALAIAVAMAAATAGVPARPAAAGDAGVPPTEVMAPRGALAEAAAGGFRVLVEADEATAARIAGALERAARKIDGLVPFLAAGAAPPGGVHRVLVLADRARYLGALRECGREPPQDGGYVYLHDANPRARLVVAYLRPAEADLLRGLVHEAAHQRLRAVVDEPPPWLNEGLALALERAVGPARVVPEEEEELEEAGAASAPVPVAHLLRLDAAEFAARSPAATLAAGRLVGALLGSPDPVRRGALAAALGALRPGAPERENVEAARTALLRAVPEATLDALAAKGPAEGRDQESGGAR